MCDQKSVIRAHNIRIQKIKKKTLNDRIVWSAIEEVRTRGNRTIDPSEEKNEIKKHV
jgi:hypothetical protein